MEPFLPDRPPPTSRDLAESLKQWALEAGFDRAGVARLVPASSGPAFEAWLTRGDHAGMDYLERKVALRVDPRLVFPGARTALCVALSYFPAPAASTGVDNDLWSGVARYARGRDYHDTMGERLAALERRIHEAFPGVGTRFYVDTGPILERDLARAAGIGAVGKNTNLLNRQGSWFLLGELLLSLDLEPDQPLPDLCGHCTRCLTACPTGALSEPYRLDSRKCISYWTIEHRGTLPEQAREMVGEWVFGCDICQEVCPWNGKAGIAERPDFSLPDHRRGLDLIGLLLLARETYVELFRGSPMKRAKLEGLQRNAAVAMGNRGEARYVPALGRALREGTETVRTHAAWALGRIGDAESRRHLTEAVEHETAGAVRDEIGRAQQRCGGSPDVAFALPLP
jgi:epoxyqueuosine reductase